MLQAMDTLQFIDACLERTNLSTREIARGSGVKESWLGMYRRGKIPNPGFRNVQLVADFFMRTGEIPVLREGRGADNPIVRVP
jgi:transcriptional regulator with XRE-family HTH domain